MAISHVCLRCGTDLAFVRPSREERYGLRVVTCPACDQRAVRSTHPLKLEKRRLIRLDASLTMLALQLSLLVGFIAANLGGGALIIEVADEWSNPHWSEERWIVIGVFGVAFPFATGVWLAAGLSHWERGWSLVALWCTMLIPIALISLIEGVSDVERQIGYAPTLVSRENRLGMLGSRVGYEFFTRVGIMSILTVMMIPGLAVGRPLILLSDSFRRWRWGWRRRKRRMRSVAV